MSKIFKMSFGSIYPLYLKKIEKKSRSKEELDQVIYWLTGYDEEGLQKQIDSGNDMETFFAEAPELNENVSLIKGVICGYRVEDIEDPLMQKIRYMDKLVDELAKGKRYYENNCRSESSWIRCFFITFLLNVVVLNYVQLNKKSGFVMDRKWRVINRLRRIIFVLLGISMFYISYDNWQMDQEFLASAKGLTLGTVHIEQGVQTINFPENSYGVSIDGKRKEGEQGYIYYQKSLIAFLPHLTNTR